MPDYSSDLFFFFFRLQSSHWSVHFLQSWAVHLRPSPPKANFTHFRHYENAKNSYFSFFFWKILKIRNFSMSPNGRSFIFLHMTKSMCIAVQLSKFFFHYSQLHNERLLEKSQNPREIRTCSLPIARNKCWPLCHRDLIEQSWTVEYIRYACDWIYTHSYINY